MAAMIRPLLWDSSLRDSSSMANTTPASGALNAAAIPAAPPATSRACSFSPRPRRSQCRALCKTPAATCTDGPSRPSDSPASKPSEPSSALPSESRSDTKRCRMSAGSVGDSAAITCGIPEPAAPGTQRRVIQTMAAVSAGVHSSTSQGCSA